MVVDTDSSIRIRIQDFEDQKTEHPAIQKIEFTNFLSIFVSLFCSPEPGFATLPENGSFYPIPLHKGLCFKINLLLHFVANPLSYFPNANGALRRNR
jgi:hypothetical protein